MRGKRRLSRTVLSSGLPQDALLRGARVTWFAMGSALIEGQRGVVELTPGRIRLRTDDGVLSVDGEALTLRELSLDAAMIDGRRIHTLTYLKPDAAP